MGGFRNWPFLLTNSTQRVGGLENAPKHSYVIFEWSLKLNCIIDIFLLICISEYPLKMAFMDGKQLSTMIYVPYLFLQFCFFLENKTLLIILYFP